MRVEADQPLQSSFASLEQQQQSIERMIRWSLADEPPCGLAGI
jgi:hypothetical protein